MPGSLRAADTAFTSVGDFAIQTGALQAQSTNICPTNPNLLPQILPVPACPAGYEGPNCDIDINECVRVSQHVTSLLP